MNKLFLKTIHTLSAMRVSHYLKNLIIFIPFFFQNYSEIYLVQSIYSFFAFCFIASVGYLFNDYKDLDTDKKNNLKKSRPLASKRLGISFYKVLGLCLLVCGFIFAFLANTKTLFFIFIYLIFSVLYTLKLKKILFIDVISLSFFYVLRLITGISANGNEITIWAILLGFIFFLNLSIIKRFVDQINFKKNIKKRLYNNSSIELLKYLILILTILLPIFSLIYLLNFNYVFITLENGILLILFIFIWVLYIAFTAIKKKVNKDIILFFLSDKTSFLLLFLIILILLNNIISFTKI